MRRYQHSELEGTEVGTTFHNDTVEGEVLLSHKRTGFLVGSFGGWFLNRAFDAIGEEALSPPVDQRAYAGFLYEEVESPHATVQFGGRLDHTSYEPAGGLRPRDFTEFSGSVGLLLKPHAANENFVIALNLARAARYPALEELYYFGPHPGNLAFEIGNPDLEAEHALGFDLSLRARGDRFEGEVSFFRNDIANYIFREPTGEVEDEFPVVKNVGADSVLLGVEAHGDVKLGGGFTLEMTYDWVKGELKASGEPLPRMPPFRVLGGVTYQKNAFQTGVSLQAVSEQTRVYGDETADRRLRHGQGVRVVLIRARRRAQHDHRAPRQRDRHAVSQPPELPEGRAARSGTQLQAGLHDGLLRAAHPLAFRPHSTPISLTPAVLLSPSCRLSGDLTLWGPVAKALSLLGRFAVEFRAEVPDVSDVRPSLPGRGSRFRRCRSPVRVGRQAGG